MFTRLGIATAAFLLLASTSELAVGQYSWVEANGAFSRSPTVLVTDSSGALFAGGDLFLRVSRDADECWQALPFPPGGFPAYSILIAADHSLLLGCSNALYRSTDAGRTWQATINIGVSRMILLDDGVILMTRAYAILQSFDNGATITPVASRPWGTALIAALERRGGSGALLGTPTGMFVTTNDGTTWNAVSNWVTGRKVLSMAHGSPGRLFACSDSAFFFSADSGSSWTQRASLTVPVKFLTAVTDSLLLGGTAQNGMVRSTDQGMTWAPVSGLPSDSILALTRGASGRIYVATGASALLRSTDGGVTWEKLNGGFKGKEFNSVLTTGSGAILCALTGYDLVRSADQGPSWMRSGIGVPGRALIASRPNGVFMAALDSVGFFRSTDDGASWLSAGTVSIGTTFHKLIFAGNTVLAGTESGILRTTDSGLTWLSSAGISGRVNAILALPSGSLLAAGPSGVFRSTDAGGNWITVSSQLTNVLCMTLTDAGKLFAGTSNGVFVSADSGSVWTASGLSGTSINVLYSPMPSLVLAGGATGLFSSTDQGSTWNSAGISQPVRSLDVTFAGRLLAGTSDDLLMTTQPILYDAGITAWMTAGSLHDWFSSRGSEIEEGEYAGANMQDGLQWPAVAPYQDMKASKALWIGTTAYADPNGNTYPYKVVHVGPRVSGINEFVPISFERHLQFPLSQVTVNGITQTSASEVDVVDPTIVGDQEIWNEVNTSIGITVTRRIRQFSQPFHDNYIVHDYTFTNTGRRGVKNDAGPAATLTGVYFYFLNRYAPCADTRYAIGNATGWGKNTMLDARGDGFLLPTTAAADTDDAVNIPGVYTAPHMRAQFAWHGKFPPFTTYDNIGGPIWVPYYDPTDTTGRLGAAQFVGVATLHADKSTADKSDDPGQPSTTSWEGSDEPNTSGNNQFIASRMADEYAWMARGHKTPRHAWATEPQGKFDEPTGDPALGTPGGYSAANGYGPYTLVPGESVHVVFAEGASGLSLEKCLSIGSLFKRGLISAKAKNDSVLSGKDSLLQTFRRAIGNYKTGYGIPRPPLPPSLFAVASDSGGVRLTWDAPSAGPQIRGFEIYRALGKVRNPYTLIYSAAPEERTFKDVTTGGDPAFYYIVSVGDPADNPGTGLTPMGALQSGRYYTQTYTPVSPILSAPISEQPEQFALQQNYPNPFNPATKISYSITGRQRVLLRVYDILGREVVRLVDEVQEPGIHGVTFDGTRFATGMYIYRLEAGGRSLVRSMLLLK